VGWTASCDRAYPQPAGRARNIRHH
jgi:hypothetical protein